MSALAKRYEFLFRSTKGLILVAIALISLTTVIWGMLSGPMAELGTRDLLVRALGMSLKPAEREGRIILLYHSIAMAVVAIEVYMITARVRMRAQQRTTINSTITSGYLAAMIGGLVFGYFGRNWIFHGIFIFGLSLVFLAGVQLALALNPWQKEFRAPSSEVAQWRGIDLERTAFFVMALATLGSVLFGAIPGMYYGNGFQTFLAEDIVRSPEKTPFQLAVIGHLHIMLTLIAVALLLLLGRWADFKGPLHKIAMPLVIFATIITTIGVWLVVPFEAIAHIVINVGAVPMLIASLLLVAYAWRQQIAEQGAARAGRLHQVRALLRDPVKFGAYWQMVYMNLTVTAIGIFMAIKLDSVIRTWTLREERVTLTGHWHILSGIIATIILLYYADLIALKGRARQWFGWLVVVGSDLAFGAVAVFETRRLFVREAAQQPLVDVTLLVADASLVTVLLVLGALMVWRLLDLFKRQGRWTNEWNEELH